MSKHFLFFTFLFVHCTFHTFSQKEGGGFYIGYNVSKFSPGIGNVESTTYLYNQKYGANFKFNNIIPGPMFGFKLVKGVWQTDIWWMARHSVDESEFTDATTGLPSKMGIKIRYNNLCWGNAIYYKKFALGYAMNWGVWKLWGKRTPVEEYKSSKWERDFPYGKELSFPGYKLWRSVLPSAHCFYFDYMPKFIGVRLYYCMAFGEVEFADDASLTFYYFKPNSIGASLLLNISSLNNK